MVDLNTVEQGLLAKLNGLLAANPKKVALVAFVVGFLVRSFL